MHGCNLIDPKYFPLYLVCLLLQIVVIIYKLILLNFTPKSQNICKMCYPPEAFKLILKISSQKCHVVHCHGNKNIKIARLLNSIKCCTHKAIALYNITRLVLASVVGPFGVHFSIFLFIRCMVMHFIS